VKLQKYIPARVLVLRSENLHRYPLRTMRQAYDFLQLPLAGFKKNKDNFNRSYNTGLLNGIEKSTSHDQALGASYEPMLSKSRKLLRNLVFFDEKFPFFVKATRTQPVEEDMP